MYTSNFQLPVLTMTTSIYQPVSLPALYRYSEALGIASAEFPGHRLLVPAAAVGNSRILAYLDTSEIATGLWSEETKY
jgi:hypothetical protein